ncbi:malate dehydrogenase (quinone) [Halalkalibacillus sediminis]|uniref:Probable malate:quinone oxidoreductase n=1 Tax=Halalkalibacillus sediminis TaxID=2018042 RepID=A0A2I0QSQ3_9BACI|nr:malate dehydrogenase (quinone) [Halalkalibacillus sediminis]PKR77367.1 malate dehydrogenase (quinone) [Halalkalibacillus sediminis]
MKYETSTSDVVLIGAGIMSATLGVLLKELEPDWKLTVFEQLGSAGGESSNERNNSGTGHAALCELNYTAEQPDGTIDIEAAVKINERFQLSRQFWAHLAKRKLIENPSDFITGLPHMSFVKGEAHVQFLKKRYDALSAHPLFQEIEYSEDREQLTEWFQLIMNNRSSDEPVAGTKIDDGTDVNYGELTRKMCNYLEQEDVDIHYNHNVLDIKQASEGLWELKVRDGKGSVRSHRAKFVFIGAGGGSLPLLQKTGLPEGKHIGGFPISGQYLECTNPEIIEKHYAKVYGKNPPGAPKMVVPHLDTRYIGGEKKLIFGPFAGFIPKFLKSGSKKEFFTSVKPNNLFTMAAAGIKNFSLMQYLIQQLRLTKKERMNELREFFPDAKDEDWELKIAGQRVQVIKDTSEGKGIIQFSDTEVVHSEDRTLAALLGGSPGASTSVSDMVRLLEDCFPTKLEHWKPKIKEMIPSYGENLSAQPELIGEIKRSTMKDLALERKEK